MARAEVVLGGAVTLWAVALVLLAAWSAGPLWRDEINTFWMATRPTLSELWRWMDKDSFPVLWFIVLRGWISVGLGGTDQKLRLLGALVGVGQLAAAFWAARRVGFRGRGRGRGWPLLFLVLFALNPILFRFGTSIRAYGLGTLFLLLMTGQVWSYVQRPRPRPRPRARWWTLIGAIICALLAVHTTYYNAVALFILCTAGAGVCLAARRYGRIVGLGTVGGVCLLSVLPYVFGPVHRLHEWNALVQQQHLSLKALVIRCGLAIDYAGPGIWWAWVVLGGLVFAGCVAGWFRWRSPRRRRRALFVVLAAPLLVVCHFGFLLSLGYETQPWYYATLLGLGAFLIDRGADTIVGRSLGWRTVRLAAVVALLIWSFAGDYQQARTRATAVDLVAARVAGQAKAGDYVVVYPWCFGVSFGRYYHGPAAWTTLPAISNLECHRYDLVKEQLVDPERIGPVLERVRQTLHSGGRVWFVGYPLLPRPGEQPTPIPAAPALGWTETAYDNLWNRRLGFELAADAASVAPVPYTVGQPSNGSESPAVYVFDGAKR